MKIIYLATPSFAVPTLNALINSHHTVVAVVTQLPKQAGRGKKLTPSEVEVFATKHNIPVLHFKRISRDGVSVLSQINADMLVTCAYGQILSSEILNLKPYGVINVHASVLPKLRGSSPIQWTIINGEQTAGITILKSDVGIDDGNVILTQPTPVLQGETAEELYVRLSQLAPSVLLNALNQIESGTAKYTPQDHTSATVCSKLTKQLSQLDLTKPAYQVVNLINGINIWPVANLNIDNSLLKVYKAQIYPQQKQQSYGLNISDYKIGQVVLASVKAGLVLRGSDQFIEILQLQAPGGKRLGAKDFLNGKKLNVGSIAY